MSAPTKKKLGELLVEAGIIDEHQLRYALGHQRQWGGKLGQALVDLELAGERQIVDVLARKLGYEVVQLDDVQRGPNLDAAMKLLPRDVARRHGVLPLDADQSSVTIATSDPTNIAVTDEISFRTSRRVRIVIAGDREVARAVTRLYFPEEAANPEERGLDLASGGSSRPLNPTYDALPDHVQEHYFPSSLRDIEEHAAGAAPPPASAFAGAPPAATSAGTATGSRAAVAPSGTPVVLRQGISGASQAAREAALRDVLDKMAAGEEPPGGLRPARLVAALTRALLRRGLVTEAELVLELTQPRR